MLDSDKGVAGSLELQKYAGWDLATRIRFLREEIREGRNIVDNREELRVKALQLANLFPIPQNCKKVLFEVRDMAETDKNTSGLMFGRREVEVANPTADTDAQETHRISLLPSGQFRENLQDLGVSEILPPAQGGI